jgi:hypothetical protein
MLETRLRQVKSRKNRVKMGLFAKKRARDG